MTNQDFQTNTTVENKKWAEELTKADERAQLFLT